MANSPPSPRESSFPSTSIGRSAGSKLLSASANQHRPLSRESSRESLNAIAHPLLSPSSTATSFSNAIGSNSTGATASSVTTWDNGFSSSNLGYVPYTRPSRHRPTPTPPTHSGTHPPHAGPTSPSVIVTPATTSSSSSSATHVDLTAKLQLMSLKAAAQALGIETGTVGWIILEALAREHGAEWDTIWEALDTGKAILLLPSEPLATLKAKSNLSVVSPAFIRNHVLYTESDGKTLERAVSLSGLRGIFQEEEGQMLITFTSTLHPHSSTFHDISSPGTRAKGFASLMPQFPSSSNYTSFSLPTMTPALSLPPRRSTSLPPPLPPRRNQHQGGSVKPSTSTSDGRGGSGNSSSRFSGLASLFGRSHPSSSSSTTNPNSSSPAGSRPPSIVLSDSASAMSSEEASIKDQGEFTATSSSSSILVPTYVVSTSILEQEVLEGMWKGIVGDLERILRFSSLLDSDPSSISHIAFPLSLPNILISFLESANALPVLRITAPHPRITGSKSKAITRRLISGSGSVPAHREASQERREGKETSELEHQRSLDISHTSSHAHTDSVYYVYEVNPYGIKEGWGSAAGAGSDNSDAENRKEAETGAMEAIEDLSARWQSVYREVEDLVEEWAEAEFAETETSTRDESKGAEKEGSAVEEKEQRKREILERTERALCCAGGIYERLSPAPSPCTSWTTNISIATPATDTDESNILESTEIITDSTHDSALASRIAALVMIDFGLQDLDLDVGPETQDDDEKLKMEEEIMTILQACGNEICGIEKVFTPKEKADAMVRAHRVLVDGLSKLPFTISLKEPGPKSESQPESQRQSSSAHETEEEEVKTAVPWKKDETFPQASDDDSNVEGSNQEAEAVRAEGASELGTVEKDNAEESQNSATDTNNESRSQAASFSLDTLFPLLILSVVTSNPPNLISHLLFTQRFLFTHHIQTSSQSSSSTTGEQTYCLVNLMAVAEFIGNLDLEGVVNARTARGTPVYTEDGPIPIPVPMSLPITIGSRSSSRRASMSSQHSATSKDGSAPTTPILSSSFTLRTRVEQQASALSSSANKVLSGMSGVMDSSIGGFGGLFKSMNVNLSLPGSLPTGFNFGAEGSPAPVTPALSSAQAAAPWNHPHAQNPDNVNPNPREMMDRKESGFSIKSLKLPAMPSIPNMPAMPNLTRSTTPGPGDSREKEMVSVSRPGSVRSVRSRKSGVSSLFGGESTEEDEATEDMDEDGDEDESYEEEEEDGHKDSQASDEDEESDASESRPAIASDARSIKSFESMMSDGKRRAKAKSGSKSLSSSKKDQKKSTPLDNVAGAAGAARRSLSDRLAKVSSGITASSSKKNQAPSPPASRRSSLLVAGSSSVLPMPQYPAEGQVVPSIPATSPPISTIDLPLPNAHFLACTSAEDLRLGEVKELLQEYQSLVQAIKAAGGFAIPTPDSMGEDSLSNLRI